MKSIVFTNARDENHIVEWIAHYVNLGFDTVFVYDHKSVTPISSLVVPTKNIVIENVNFESNRLKNDLMKKALEYSKKHKYTWMLYIDADEFLCLNTKENVNKFLEDYNKYDLIGINWLCFGSNGLDNDDDTKTMLEMYTKSDKALHPTIKSFVRPDKARGPATPHYYSGVQPSKQTSVSFNPLPKQLPYWSPEKADYKSIGAYLAHYINQNYNTYLERKVNRPRDDNCEFRKPIEKGVFHKLNNEILNDDLYVKYNYKNTVLMEQLKHKN